MWVDFISVILFWVCMVEREMEMEMQMEIHM